MMHVGDKKGKILDSVLLEYKPKVVLELGTYCGYSGTRIARLLPKDGKLYTIDPQPTKTAQTLISKAGLKDKVVFISGRAEYEIPKLKKNYGIDTVDLVFIDHVKQGYLSDLLIIEKHGLLRKGSVVVADNVLVFHIDDYLKHVRNSKHYSSSVNHQSTLEYDDSGNPKHVDGIEVSIYAGSD
eukprot:TRINITY_DN6365_c0_g2_i1.p1 TRINITY_DN6365_c0_g2~~TRINITY_DN6365_c0_g2_i1.p1  ORF type:complete len:183 (-),score=32.30 TRINITY_DN6365_c0_g2_i1:85-633(-)